MSGLFFGLTVLALKSMSASCPLDLFAIFMGPILLVMTADIIWSEEAASSEWRL